MNDCEGSSTSTHFYVHGNGISALTLTYKLREAGVNAVLVEPEAKPDREHASQHAQCVLHRGYFYASKLQNFYRRRSNYVHPRIATQLYAASLLWEPLLAEFEIDRAHGMVWLTANSNDSSAIDLACRGLRRFLCEVLPKNAEHLNRTLSLVPLSNGSLLPWEGQPSSIAPDARDPADIPDDKAVALMRSLRTELAPLDTQLANARAAQGSAAEKLRGLEAERWLSARETLSNLALDLPSVEAFGMDQWVVRPCCALDRLKHSTARLAESAFEGTDSQVEDVPLKALGREQFASLTQQPVRTRDHWLIMARGDLPYVNVLLHNVIRDWRINKLASVLIVSHRCSDGKTVWLIDTSGFDALTKSPECNPSVEIFDEMVGALEKYIRFSDGLRLRNVQWYKYRADLPDLSGLDGDIASWCLHKTENSLHVYNYRFTLAPLVAQRAVEALGMHAARAESSRTRGNLAQSISNAADRPSDDLWGKFADKFQDFQVFRDGLVHNSPTNPTM